MTNTAIKTGYKQTEVGVIPNDWEVKKIREVCKLVNGRGFKPFEWKNEGLPIIRIQNLNGSDDFNYFLGQYDKKLEVENGQLLFAWSGSRGTSFGPHIWNGSKGLLNYHTWKIIVNENEIVKSFFTHALKNLTKSIEDKAHGASALVHTQKWEMEGFDFPLPFEKSEQTAIAAALSDADQYITHIEQLIAKKRNIKQGAMQELLKPKEGWGVRKLGEECEVITKGTTPTSVGREFQSIGINFIKIESLEKNGKIIQDKVAFIDSRTHSLLKRSQLRSGDLLFSIAGALGRVAMVDDEILPANTNQALAIVRLKKDSEIDFKYLFFFLNTVKVQAHILTISVQGAQANLSLQNISELQIEYPLKSEQTHLSTVLSDMDAEIATLETKLSKAKSIKQGMMQQLLTGKIRLI